MKAVINAQVLAKELKKISPIIKKNSVLPILSCVKLSFEKGKLVISATDLETLVLVTVDCECTNPFVIVIEYSSLLDACSKIFEPISIDASGKEISIISGTTKFKFAKTNNEETFPKIDTEEFLFDINVEVDFFTALLAANSCRSDDNFKPALSYPCIHVKKDILTLVGTDAHVLYKTDMKIKTGKEIQALVNDPFVQMVKGFGSAKVSFGEKFIKAEYANMVVMSRLIDSKYCFYENIIPKDLEFNFKIERASLIKSLGVAGVASDPSTHFCVISFNGGDIKIESKDIVFGKESETKVKAIHTVEIPSIGVNGNQMLKLLNLFDSEEVEMAFRGENSTILLRPFGEPNTVCLLQPLMINA